MSGNRADHTRQQGVRSELLAPYRMLAVRVITLAVRDLVADGQSAPERHSARVFLSGSRMLTHWCRLADLDPAAITDHVRGFVEHKPIAHSGGRR